MTREDTIKVLAILKAAYPNAYKNMTREEANGTVTVWSMQFAAFPVELVLLAINKIVATSAFAPTISEVKDKIRGMYWELWTTVHHENGRLDEQQLKQYTKMLMAVERLRASSDNEPAISDILGAYNQLYIT